MIEEHAWASLFIYFTQMTPQRRHNCVNLNVLRTLIGSHFTVASENLVIRGSLSISMMFIKSWRHMRIMKNIFSEAWEMCLMVCKGGLE